MDGVYHHANVTRASIYSEIESATANLLGAVGELAELEWTETSSRLVDLALSVAERVKELRALADDEQPMMLPANVVTGPWDSAA
jgi:hypothetical protein